MGFAICPLPGVREWRPLRGATRYPIQLRVTLLSEGRQMNAVTEDLSASGVLFRLDEPLREGQLVEFLLEIPPGTLDLGSTAAVHCSGRIVRSFRKRGFHHAAAVIDEYRFQ